MNLHIIVLDVIGGQAVVGGDLEPGLPTVGLARRGLPVAVTHAARAAHAGLRVPSAIVPQRPNLLLNPAHPDADRARVVAGRHFAFDRLLRRPA